MERGRGEERMEVGVGAGEGITASQSRLMLVHSSHTEARLVLVSGVSMLVGEALTVRVVATRLVRRRRRVEGCMVVWCGWKVVGGKWLWL
jgi:hypothetical protein